MDKEKMKIKTKRKSTKQKEKKMKNKRRRKEKNEKRKKKANFAYPPLCGFLSHVKLLDIEERHKLVLSAFFVGN